MKRILCMMMLCSAVVAGCGRNTSPVEKCINVGVMSVDESFNTYGKEYLGTVITSKIQLMLAPHNGTVSSINVKAGQKLKKGAVMVSVDAPNVKSLNKSSQATLAQARDGYERAKKVYEGGGLSEIKWMEVQTQLAQAESAAEISNKSLEDCKIKAPFKGTVSEVFVTLGEDVTVGKRIASIIDEDELEVTISIPENEYPNIHEGDSAVVSVAAIGAENIIATVSRLGVNSTSISHSYETRLTLQNYPTNLKAGMACKVHLRNNFEQRIVVPLSSVKTDDEGRYVWVVGADSRVEKRRVATGSFADSGIAITEGLSESDRVIVEGISKISTGMKVNPIEVDAQ